MVRLPFSENQSSLGETKNVALSRFQALERRLAKDPSLRSQYIDFMNYDPSDKSASGLSLNDILYIGPTTQGDLFGMLRMFRLQRLGFSTDIDKMYVQF